jgi:eukaryotic-like serine/threonine-protein kinase
MVNSGHTDAPHGVPTDPQGAKILTHVGIITRVGKYRVDGLIGRGSVGVVYKAYDGQIDRPVAIKTLRLDILSGVANRDSLLKRFSTEARSAGRCVHPNIVTVFDYVEQDDTPYIVMEFVDAGTLENVINSGTMLPLRQVGEIMVQLVSALEHAHSKGIVHRDVKPSNILCPTATSIKVTDFGVARFDATGLTNATGLGAIGTPNYMSPEQFLGRPVDGRSDLYAAGVVLFEMLTGAKPYVARDLPELMRKLLNDKPPHLSTLRPGQWRHLDAVVQRALARNPDDRFQTGGEFIDALNMAIEATGTDDSQSLDLTEISLKLENKSTKVQSSSSQNVSTGHSKTMSAKLTSETLGVVELALARVIGPIARIVLKRASEAATDPETLLSSLAAQIPVESEARRFRELAERAIRDDTGIAGLQLDAMISNADADAAHAALLPLIGPIAKVLVKRSAQKAMGHEDFYKMLAEYIPDEAQRIAFLAKMKPTWDRLR